MSWYEAMDHCREFHGHPVSTFNSLVPTLLHSAWSGSYLVTREIIPGTPEVLGNNKIIGLIVMQHHLEKLGIQLT